MPTIPASTLVNVIPSVIAAGGSQLQTIGLMLTTNTRVPIGTIQQFPNPAAVSSFFGATAAETLASNQYFAGFTNDTATPANLLFAQYNTAPVAAYLRGGNISALPLTTLQSYNATLSVTIDGSLKSATVNLAAATSFSNAASIIGQSLGIQGTLLGSVTGQITTTTLTVSGAPTFTIAPGDVISGTGVTVGTYIVSQLSGTPGGGGGATYQVSVSQSAGPTAITFNNPGCQYDSVSGAFVINSGTTGSGSTITYGSGAMATNLLLTQALGAVTSQGAAAQTSPSGFMNNIVATNANWVAFMTLFDPDGGSGNTTKQAFAAWKQTQNQKYAYVCWDPDTAPTTTVPASSSLGAILAANGDSGTCLIWEAAETGATGSFLASFVLGCVASINFSQQNGRITFAYKSAANLVANVTNATTAANLVSNGYNYYGAFANASNQFVNFQNGSCTGPFKWFDSYINQIWLNNSFQTALLQFLQNALSVPYSVGGNAQIAAALQPPITSGLNFRAYGPGIVSASEANSINSAAGNLSAANTVAQQGWYLQILAATPAQRAARTSPPANFWYLDQGSVQQINLASIEVQ
jgi:hypothetical protein